MSKIILGSGIVGLLAREILGNSWTIIPFSQSRFFSFSPALDDNYIICDEKINDFMEHLGAKPDFIYKISYSIIGQLETHKKAICDAWLGKIFGSNPPPHAAAYMKSRTNLFVYNVRINRLYETLQNKYKKELKQNAKLTIDKIGDHFFESNKKRHNFDAAINTIPINKLSRLCELDTNLETKQIWYYHIKTPDLDFEGANQVLVVDPEYAFYKVNNIAPNRYIFHCTQEIQIPGPYFMQFMNRLDIIDGTTINDVIPVGPIANTKHLKQLGITCIGAHAEHDWCADVGSNIMSLLRVKNQLG